MKGVFLSYARGDEPVARELTASLGQEQLMGWMDQTDIAAGEAIACKVKESLREASVIVVLLSERSLRNQWVQFEIGAAIGMNKPIIPILIGQPGIEPSLPQWLERTMCVDARGRPMEEVAKKVARALSDLTARGLVMTKAALVDKIARDAGITKKAAELTLGSFVAGVRESLKKGKEVTLVGFGTFAVARRAARSGRNPRTGEVVKIKAAKVPRFRAGKALKDAVR